MKRLAILGFIPSIIIFSFLSLSIFFAGCGRKDEREEEGKIVIKYAWGGFARYDPIRVSHSHGFDKKFPGVEVRHEAISGGAYLTKIFTMIAAGGGLDVFATYEPHTTYEMARRGALLDLTDFVSNDPELNPDEINKALVEEGMYKGRLYGLPANSNNLLLYYNKKHFNEAGLEYPDKDWTWEELIEAGKKLTIRDENGRIKRFGLAHGPDWLQYASLNGAEFWSKTKDKCIINSPIARDVVQFFYDISHKYEIAPKLAQTREIGGATWDLFIPGRTSMLLAGYWINALCKQAGFTDYGVSYLPLMPGVKRREWYGGMHWVVPANTKHPRLAYELAKYIVRVSEVEKLVAIKDSLPIRYNSPLWDKKELWDKRDYLPDGRLIYQDMLQDEAISGAILQNDRLKVSFTQINSSIIESESDLFFYGKKSAEEVLETIEQKVNHILE